MQFTVKDWMKDVVLFAEPDDLVQDVLAAMRKRYVNSVIVRKTADSPEFGIITSIDICDKIVAQQRNPTETRAREIMNSPLITVQPGMSLLECAALMKANLIHHLPVMDNKGEIVGMISATDFLMVAEGLGTGYKDRSLT
jgi:signal-transduction protein with cAMP-binding, CBS, and nucleotidyltransferase domain